MNYYHYLYFFPLTVCGKNLTFSGKIFMVDIALSGQAALEPYTLQARGLTGIPEEWRPAVRMHRPCEGLYITCMNGQPGTRWAFQAEGPPVFNMNVLLEGRMQTALDDAVLDVQAGSVILMAANDRTAGWNVLDGAVERAFRMISIHLPCEDMALLTGLQMEDLCHRLRARLGEQPHRDAFLGLVPASGKLQRVTRNLLEFAARVQPGTCRMRDLYLRAKALEVIAGFLLESLVERAPQPLPVPADRPRLLEARALLERGYEKEWSVRLLACAVGLNEKRLQSGFRALFGCTVRSFLTRVRINAAAAMLDHGVCVTETAARCGFTSLSHFSRIFSAHTGVSPKRRALGH
jgi:AraC-like DNA-binding protein